MLFWTKISIHAFDFCVNVLTNSLPKNEQALGQNVFLPDPLILSVD